MSQPAVLTPSAQVATAVRPAATPAQELATDPGSGVAGLITAVAALARTATEPFTVNELLRHLVDLAAEHLTADGAGAMVAEGADLLYVHGSTTEVDQVERLQELMQQGPCQEAKQLLREVAVGDLSEATLPSAWARYRAGAEVAGLRAVVAVPLVSRGCTWGVLDLYRCTPGAWSEEDLAAARLLADVAVSYVVMAIDRDEARRAQRELAHRSMHDELTGLPNRALLFDRLEHALTAAARHQQAVAVFFIDLDRFKQINDTFGHADGDKVLVQVTSLVAETLRDEDTLARLSGDEFVVVCEQLPQHADGELDSHLKAVARRIHAALSTPIRIGGVDVVVTASVGIAVSDRHSTGDDLVSEADSAMYRAKQRRHGEVVIRAHNPELSLRSARHLDRELSGALIRDELRVHYQPIVAAGDLRVSAVEALVRWQHPAHGLLSASEFIDVAENTGMIASIGGWLIDSVCAQQRAWLDQLEGQAPRTVYVNLSARELADSNLAATLQRAVDYHGLQPANLGLELLEACFIDPHLLPVLLRLHEQGHPLSVDDFGTGYSSLSRLIQLPIGAAKIDRSFATEVEHNPRSRALVEAVLVVASKLGLQVIGEGVETPEQARYLREAGCHMLQGFYFGAPKPAKDLTADWLRSAEISRSE